VPSFLARKNGNTGQPLQRYNSSNFSLCVLLDGSIRRILLKITKFERMFEIPLLTNYLWCCLKKTLMRKPISVLLALMGMAFSGKAQYFYKDIVSNRQVVNDMAAYRENKVKSFKVNSFEANGEQSDGFYCEKRLAKDYRSSAFFTKSDMAGNSILENYFDASGRLLKTYDSSGISVSSSQYFYDQQGRIEKIISAARSRDDDYLNELIEEHIYSYNPEGYPLSMLKVKNRTDSLVVYFSLDERNNVAIEKDSRSGAKYYYYYDEKNRLTDVVHANEYRQKLVADYIFEYNATGQISSMTTTEDGGNNSFIWKYDYASQLRIKERLFTRDGKLMGKIEYDYQYK
jgi:hypothetical protein